MPEGLRDPVMLVLALGLDLALRELPNRFHPTAWMGRTVAWAEKLSPSGPRASLAAGVMMVVLIAGGWTVAAFFAVYGLRGIHQWVYILVGATVMALVLGRGLFKMLGGLTGDTYGAINELVEVAALAAAAALIPHGWLVSLPRLLGLL